MIGTPLEIIAWLSTCDQSRRYECKEKREKRSLTQNRYYWAMLNQLARVLGMRNEELHLNMLREYGVADEFHLAPSVPVGAYFDYYDELGIDWIEGEERRVIRSYKGSSRMDSAEFSRLINGMREECEAQGIDVKTPEEIARMERF